MQESAIKSEFEGRGFEGLSAGLRFGGCSRSGI